MAEIEPAAQGFESPHRAFWRTGRLAPGQKAAIALVSMVGCKRVDLCPKERVLRTISSQNFGITHPFFDVFRFAPAVSAKFWKDVSKSLPYLERLRTSHATSMYSGLRSTNEGKTACPRKHKLDLRTQISHLQKKVFHFALLFAALLLALLLFFGRKAFAAA